MRKVLFLICCFCLVMNLPAQEKEKVQGIEAISQKLEKANQALSKKLDKINKKLTKKLTKAYPQLQGVNIDSLLEKRVIQNAQLQQLDSAGNTELTNVIKADSLFNDSTLRVIHELKAQLAGELGQTPKGLSVNQHLSESLTQLGKTEELLKTMQVPAIPELPNLDLPEIPSVPNVNELLSDKSLDDLKSSFGDISKLMDEYKGEFEGWEEKLLNQVTSLEEVKLLQEQKKRMEAYSLLPEGYRENMEGMQTNDFVKEKLQAKAEELKRVGAKSIQEKFDEAQAKLAEAKEKFPSLESVKDAPKRAPNPYKGEPFVKRLKFGFNFQVNRQEPTSMDLGFSASYLLNRRARIGTGMAYRIGLEKDLGGVNFDDQVFGFRTFFEYTLFKSIYAQALYEWSNTQNPLHTQPSDEPDGNQWVPSGMLGLGNRFTIKKKLTGNFTALYNFLHNSDSPNPSPWVFRFGFEF